APEEIALAVVVSFRDHRAVERKQYEVDRHGPADVGEDLVAEGLIDRAHQRAAGLGVGTEALDHVPAALLREPAPDVELSRAIILRPARRIAVGDEALGKSTRARGYGRKGIRLGVEPCHEKPHALGDPVKVIALLADADRQGERDPAGEIDRRLA